MTVKFYMDINVSAMNHCKLIATRNLEFIPNKDMTIMLSSEVFIIRDICYDINKDEYRIYLSALKN